MHLLFQIDTFVALQVMLGGCVLLVIVFGRLKDPIDDEVVHSIRQSAELVAICAEALDERLFLDSGFGEFCGVRWQLPSDCPRPAPLVAPPVAALRH